MTPEFKAAFDAFCAIAQKKQQDFYHEQYTEYYHPQWTIGVTYGKKFAKLIHQRDGVNESVYCFVDLTNGDILKSASWAKPHPIPRGSIFSADNGASAVNCYGANYLR